ncbi:MAG: hypothetical protein AABZ47_13035 [Planctomycetota bacterium]
MLNSTACVRPIPRVTLEPITLALAAGIVNRNIASVSGTLRAVGSVDGHFATPEGNRRSYHLDGTLFFLSPGYIRFDLRTFGDTQMLFGSNRDQYWCYNKHDDSWYCGTHDGTLSQPHNLPARPDQLVAALGLTPIPIDTHGRSTHPRFRAVQRVVDEAQQVLFIASRPGGQAVIEREIWLDRYPPQLVRRVVYRDTDGVVDMESLLDDYRRMGEDGPLLPMSMTARWPKLDADMRFDVRQWSTVSQVGPTSIQFATPKDCANGKSMDQPGG